MIEGLLFAHVVALIAVYRLLSGRIGRVLALTWLSYMTIFTVLKPVLLYYYDLYYPYSTNDAGAVESLLAGSLMFLGVLWVAVRFFGDRAPPALAMRIYDFDGISIRGVVGAFLVLMLVSFGGSTLKFNSPTYMFSLVDAFEASMNLANGSWYLNYIAEILFYGLLMVVACSYWRFKMTKSLAIVLGTILLTYFWTKMSSRTGALVVIVGWMSCYFSVERQRRINIFWLGVAGYLMLILLYVGNLVRTGNAGNLSLDTAIFGAVFAAASDLSPVDNATLMYSEMWQHDPTWFLYLLGSITPTVLLPSSLFPFKIPADKDAELTRIFFPGGADTAFYHEGSTLTFTVPATGYADAGYLGVFVACVLYAMIMCWYIWLFRNGSRSTRFLAGYLIVVHTVGYRLSIETLLVAFYSSMMFFVFTRRLALFFGSWSAAVQPAPRRIDLA